MRHKTGALPLPISLQSRWDELQFRLLFMKYAGQGKHRTQQVPEWQLLLIENETRRGVGIEAELELAALDQVADVRGALLEEMKKVKADGRHSVLLMLTDVVKEGTDLVVISDDPALIEQAFNSKLSGTSMWIDGMMSRKKQTIPNLQKAFGC